MGAAQAKLSLAPRAAAMIEVAQRSAEPAGPALLEAALTIRESAADRALTLLGVQSGNESADNLAMPGRPTLSDLVSVAEDEARRLGQRYVGTEHLLLAALRDGAVARRLESHVGDHRLVRGNLTRAALDLGEGGRWDSAGGDHTWCELADDLDGTTAVSGQRELAELILDRTVRLEPLGGWCLSRV